MSADETEVYAFTFGVGHRNHDRFVKIEAANEVAARLLMIEEYGREWSSVYLWDDFAPRHTDKYGYVELPFGENA